MRRRIFKQLLYDDDSGELCEVIWDETFLKKSNLLKADVLQDLHDTIAPAHDIALEQFITSVQAIAKERNP